MKRFKKTVVALTALLLTAANLFSQTHLETSVYNKVMDSVFEIIVEKHEEDETTYERELPVDRIPFKIRNDKYTPIGTAFLLSDGSFYTAAHVIELRGESVYDKYFIRDQAGDVFEITEIEKFSLTRDFIKFIVPSYKMKDGQGLTICNSVDVNSLVFSVGNALGEGIIIRNGTYTSQTYEDLDGAWKWYRFSAAASPGNSGGPLINANGEVLGIITMKSQNENLNYALPMKEALDSPKNKGIIDYRYNYRVPNIQTQTFYNKVKKELNLPMSLMQARKEVTQIIYSAIKTQMAEIKKDYCPNGKKGFDKGKNKAQFLCFPFNYEFPLVMYQKQNGEWDFTQPELSEVNLENNGLITMGSVLGYNMFKIKKPDDVKLLDLIENPKMYADYLINASSLYRTIAGEKINITSLGASKHTEIYKDCFDRNWHINYFYADWADAVYITWALPLPNGLFVLTTLRDRDALTNGTLLDAEFLIDHIHLRYAGKLPCWEEYVNLPEKYNKLKNHVEAGFNIRLTDGKYYFKSEGFEIKLTKDMYDFNEKASMSVVPGYEIRNGKTVISDMQVNISSDSNNPNYRSFRIYKINEPLKDAKDDDKNSYKSIKSKITPFDGVPFINEKYTESYLVLDVKKSDGVESVYFLAVEMLGQTKNEEMKELQEKVSKAIKILK